MNQSTPIDKTLKTSNKCEEFLQEARVLESSRSTKTSILNPYHDEILFAYDNGIKIVTILKILKGKGIKTSYDNVRSYVRSHRGLSSSKSLKTLKLKNKKVSKTSKKIDIVDSLKSSMK